MSDLLDQQRTLLDTAGRLDGLAEDAVGDCADRIEWASQYTRLAASRLADAIAAHCDHHNLPMPTLPDHRRTGDKPFPSSF